ncbi:MAG: LysR family transcriptional regulator [Clostridia bacterium]|nr:LysR family transcriptional regulator [Clostridia bacterium]
MQFSNINYNLYKSFLVVYETQNISRAAESLFISQPAVSHNIKELEKQLGIQLFYKKANGMNATNEADILYKYISSAFNSIWKGEHTITDMAGLNTGYVKIGAPAYISVIFLSKIITEFRKEHPNVKIEIVNKPINELNNMLSSQNLDIIFDSSPVTGEKNRVETTYIKSYEHCFVATDKFYTGKTLGIEGVNNLPLIITSQTSEEIKLLKSTYVDIKINPIIEAASADAVIKFVKDGNGVGYIQEDYVAQDLATGELKKINLAFSTPKLDVYCGYLTNEISYAPKKFLEFLMQKN